MNSTLDAETQSLQKGFRSRREQPPSTTRLAAPVWEDATNIDDAKTMPDGHQISLFDHLVKPRVGGTKDRRTAAEMQVVRESTQVGF